MTEGFGVWVQHFWITKTVVVRMVDLNPPPVLPTTVQPTGTDNPIEQQTYRPQPEYKAARVIGLILLILLVAIPLVLAFFGVLTGLLYALWFLGCCLQDADSAERVYLFCQFLVVPPLIAGYASIYVGYKIIGWFVSCLSLG